MMLPMTGNEVKVQPFLHSANFILRVKETRDALYLSLQNLKTGNREEFSSWLSLWTWLEQEVRHEGLR